MVESNSVNSLNLVALIKLSVIRPLVFCVLLTALGEDDVRRKRRCKHCVSLRLVEGGRIFFAVYF